MVRVVVICGDVETRTRVTTFLETQRFDLAAYPTLDDGVRELRRTPTDIAILDDSSLQGDALALVRAADERVTIVALVEPTASDGTAVRPAGADHVITKPIERGVFGLLVGRVVESQRARRRSIAFHVQEDRRSNDPFVGTSSAITALYAQAHRVLDSNAPILIQGETGTGKGVLANWLHQHGPRAEEAFVDINCAGLAREFVESELFGHDRGAFTGASAAKLGLLEVAHRGTAFLDEIGEIDLQLQPRLLKVLEDKKFRRLGDVRDRVVDVRLIAATNRNLGRRAADGTFRADLYYRINTISLTVPSLRDRREDIPILSRRIANSLGHDIDFSADAITAMQAYDWPGNIRELRNVIERAVLISNRTRITPDELRFESETGIPARRAPRAISESELGTLADAERRHIERVLERENGSVEKAAVRLGVSRSTLYQKLRRFRDEKP